MSKRGGGGGLDLGKWRTREVKVKELPRQKWQRGFWDVGPLGPA